MNRKVLALGMAFAAIAALTGCESWNHVKQKVAAIDLSLPSFATADKKGPAITSENGVTLISAADDCPTIGIVEDLRSLSQFQTAGNPTDGNVISSVTLSGLKAKCVHNEDTVAIDMNLRFDGKLGPKATAWSDKAPHFAYPYFVAITAPDGSIMGKEIFAATLDYSAGSELTMREESLRQVIPLKETADAASYKLLIGFQLTPDELAYNRAKMMPGLEPRIEPAAAAGMTSGLTDRQRTEEKMAEPAIMKESDKPVEMAPENIKPLPVATTAAKEEEGAPVPLSSPAPAPAAASSGGSSKTVIEINPDGSATIKR